MTSTALHYEILAAMTEEESYAKSVNTKWGIRESMKKGNVKLNYSQFLGYTKDTSGELVIIPEEAEIVRLIFDLYLKGNGARKIKKYLEEHGIKTVTGKDKWSTATIDRMLENEKYMGTLLLQKTYTPDFRTGKQEKNIGQRAKYLIDNNHEAIIDKETWEKVQRRKTPKE